MSVISLNLQVNRWSLYRTCIQQIPHRLRTNNKTGQWNRRTPVFGNDRADKMSDNGTLKYRMEIMWLIESQ